MNEEWEWVCLSRQFFGPTQNSYRYPQDLNKLKVRFWKSFHLSYYSLMLFLDHNFYIFLYIHPNLGNMSDLIMVECSAYLWWNNNQNVRLSVTFSENRSKNQSSLVKNRSRNQSLLMKSQVSISQLGWRSKASVSFDE